MRTTPSTFTIGSDAACDVVLADQTVAPCHAQVQLLADGPLILSDCGQAPNTKVVHRGEARSVRRAILTAEDHVRLGDVEMSVSELVDAIRYKHPDLEWQPSAGSVGDQRPAGRALNDDQPGKAAQEDPSRAMTGAADATLLPCPRCGKMTDSLKQHRLHHAIVFLVLAYWMQMRDYTACPACMRGILAERTLLNIPGANIVWPVILVCNAVHFAGSFRRGHSKKVRERLL